MDKYVNKKLTSLIDELNDVINEVNKELSELKLIDTSSINYKNTSNAKIQLSSARLSLIVANSQLMDCEY